MQQTLKGCRSIAETKGHPSKLKFSPWGAESCLRHVSFFQRGLIKSPVQIILDNNFASPSWSIRSSIKGMAYGSGIVMLLTFKTMQRCTEPSGFLTGTIGVDQGLKDCLTMPCSKRDNTSTRSCSFHAGANRHRTDLMVCAPQYQSHGQYYVSCLITHITLPNFLSPSSRDSGGASGLFQAFNMLMCTTRFLVHLVGTVVVPLDSSRPSTC